MSAFWHFCDMPARADEDRYQSENRSFQGYSHQPIELIECVYTAIAWR